MCPIKSVAKSLLCGLYKYSGAGYVQERLERWAGRQLLPILLFHRVTDLIPPDGLTVGTERFRAICRLLRDGFRVVPLDEVARLLRERRPFPLRTVAITFDDCYRDNLDAARILAEHGLPAAFFVPTAFVGTDHVFPWDRHLRQLPNLSWDDVREMARLGFEIGSHTVSHACMGRVTREQARTELFASKGEIENRLGRPVRWFAYPFGGKADWTPQWNDLLDEAGYTGCLAGHGGFVHPGADLRLLPRDPVNAEMNLLNLELHLRGLLDWFYASKRYVGVTPYERPREAAPEEPAPPASGQTARAESQPAGHV
jgi:peptidoglycan/xylan/chitin deacetylase (PgdA/CDA1 family)